MDIHTDRLALRPWDDADAPALFELARDPRVGTAAGWPPHTSVEESLEIIRNVLRGPEQYAIARKDGTLVGAIGLIGHERCSYVEAEDEFSAGYWIGAPFWGHGYAPEALRALMEHAKRDLAARAIWADHFEQNEASHRVMEKCGLEFVRRQPAAEMPFTGENRTIVIMRREL